MTDETNKITKKNAAGIPSMLIFVMTWVDLFLFLIWLLIILIKGIMGAF